MEVEHSHLSLISSASNMIYRLNCLIVPTVNAYYELSSFDYTECSTKTCYGEQNSLTFQLVPNPGKRLGHGGKLQGS